MRGAEIKFGALILAAGASKRLGRPKQLIEIDGKPMVARTAAAALGALAEVVVVVLGANGELVRMACDGLGESGPSSSRLLFTENRDWAEGMGSSIRAGIGSLRAASPHLDAALIAVSDQPAFSVKAISRLMDALAASGKGIAAARYAGRNGSPVVFRREYFDRLGALTGDRGAHSLLALEPAKVVSVEMPELAFDLDEQADLPRWKNLK